MTDSPFFAKEVFPMESVGLGNINSSPSLETAISMGIAGSGLSSSDFKSIGDVKQLIY